MNLANSSTFSLGEVNNYLHRLLRERGKGKVIELVIYVLGKSNYHCDALSFSLFSSRFVHMANGMFP